MNKKNKAKIEHTIKEANRYYEYAPYHWFGDVLNYRNFFRRTWAKWSWGRYWGWDPKESLGAISIMVCFLFYISA